MKRLAAFVLAALHAAGILASERVDDTGTVVSTPVAAMRWRQLVPGRGADHTVEARLNVALRLNLAPWQGRSVRLYMALPPLAFGTVTAAWRTQGRLLAGSVRSGSRALVYEGPVNAPLVQESLELTLATDGRALVRPETLNFTFELDPR